MTSPNSKLTPDQIATDPKRITITQMTALFGVGGMTVYNWRQGSSVRTPLPCHKEPVGNGVRERVYFKKAEVRAWIKTHGIPDPWATPKNTQSPTKTRPAAPPVGRGKAPVEKRAQ